MARPEKNLTEQEQLETKIFILENHHSQMKLHDAQMHKYAIEIVRDLRKSSLSFNESKRFIMDTCESAAVADIVVRLLSHSDLLLANIDKQVTRIIEDLG